MAFPCSGERRGFLSERSVPLRAVRVDRAAELFYAVAEPHQFLFGDPVMLRIAGLHIGLFQLLEPCTIFPAFARPGIDQPHVDAFSLRAQEPEIVDMRRVESANQQDAVVKAFRRLRSEEHTSELQSLMRISYAVFCLKKKKQQATM